MKRKIKFSLIKKGCTFADIIKGATKKSDGVKIEKREGFEFISDNHKVKIKNHFINKITGQKNEAWSIKQFIVICFKIRLENVNREIVVSNGDIRLVIDAWKLEPNFGIKTWINYHLQENKDLSFKNIDFKNRVNGNHFKQSKPTSSSIWGFSYNQITDFLKALLLKTTIDNTKTTIMIF